MLYEYEYVKVIYIHESWIICVKVEKWIGKEWYKMKIMKLCWWLSHLTCIMIHKEWAL